MAEKKSLILRIDPKLFDALNEWAKDELRSVNAQIEYILREQVKKRGKNLDKDKGEKS
ncbi:MAG: hypothetical protein IAE91_03480 [Ignavibacteriaceae bacterium]|nr:hypothetical protein [Ignavibacteriaceae bacterium]